MDAEAFCQACIDGDLNTLHRILQKDPEAVNSFGLVHPDHRTFMKKENAEGGWSALHLASHYGRLEVVVFLLENGADIDAKAQNSIGNTPLMSAVAGGRIEIVRFLLDEGADLTLTDKENFTPLQLAQVEKKPEIAALIREYLHS
jgi:ankyrin repeat protein